MLKAKNVSKIYQNGAKEVRAVDGISLEIEKGEAVAIVGPSGAGKSTLLHLLGGLDSPTSGSIIMDGTDIYSISDRERAKIRNRRAGFVFQFYHLLPEFTALENVMMPALIGKCQGVKVSKYQSVKEKAKNLLAAVGLADRINHRPAELSGGESQRVAIARSLTNEPEVLLCDEPTGNLDSKMGEAIYNLLLDIKSRAAMALVIATHDERISSRIGKTLHIRDGKIR